MDRPVAIRFLGVGCAIEGALLIALLTGARRLGGGVYVPAIGAFVAGFLISAFLCGRSGLRLSGVICGALCALAYITSAPLAAWVETRVIPQDYLVLLIAVLMWGLVLVPLTALGCAVINAAAFGSARRS